MADNTYVPPQFCTGQWRLGNDNECIANHDALLAQQYAAESLEIAGAIVNVFKLLGVHEQGKLLDLTGDGYPLSSGAAPGSDASNAFDISTSSWLSTQQGQAVVTTPAFLGYNFGIKKTSAGTTRYAPPKPVIHQVSTIRIQQGGPSNRVLQARVERSDGDIKVGTITNTGSGNGVIYRPIVSYSSSVGTVRVLATSSSALTVEHLTTGQFGNATVGVEFNSPFISFTPTGAFVAGDEYLIQLTQTWFAAAVINLPNTGNLETISFPPSVPSPNWRLVPLLFTGGATDSWEVIKLELIDYNATALSNIEDDFFLENRDRDYARVSIPIKCHYQPFDSVGDLGKFGFSILDQYVFTCSFAKLVEALGRPIVIGDLIEVTPEVAYDQYLKPVKKYLEVTDAGWSSEGYTPGWLPTLYRFQATQALASTETRDLFGFPQDKLDPTNTILPVDDTVTTVAPLVISKATEALAIDNVPETGQDTSPVSAGLPAMAAIMPVGLATRDDADGTDLYVQDAMPPDNLPYGEGFAFPTNPADGDYFRMNYAPETNIPPRLFKYSAIKMKWIYLETDTRGAYSSYKPSVRNALQSMTKQSLKDKL